MTNFNNPQELGDFNATNAKRKNSKTTHGGEQPTQTRERQ